MVEVVVRPVPYAAAAELVEALDADLGVRYGSGGDPVHAPAFEFDVPGSRVRAGTPLWSIRERGTLDPPRAVPADVRYRLEQVTLSR